MLSFLLYNCCKLLALHSNLILHLLLTLWLKFNSQLIINEWNNHIILNWNQIWGDMILHLLQWFQEDISTIRWRFFFPFFRYCPSFLWLVAYWAMVCRYGFEFYLNISLHWSSNGIDIFLTVSINCNLILNVLFLLINANPRRSSSKHRKIISIDIILKLWS